MGGVTHTPDPARSVHVIVGHNAAEVWCTLLYYSVVVQSCVGYGDIVPNTTFEVCGAVVGRAPQEGRGVRGREGDRGQHRPTTRILSYPLVSSRIFSCGLV